MNRTILWTLLLLATIWGCDQKKEPVDNSLKLFKVEGSQSKFDIEFRLPGTFVSVWEMDEEKQMDTTDIQLNWILDVQSEDPDSFCFFDSLDKKINIYVKSDRELTSATKREI